MLQVSRTTRTVGLWSAALAAATLLSFPVLGVETDVEARININTASVEELSALPGVGPAIALRIVEYREKNGPFRKTVELMNVKGIGEKSFERLRDAITVQPEDAR